MATREPAAGPTAEPTPTSAREFSLADLVPTPLPFRDTDGQVYDVKTADMFGPREYAAFRRILRRYYAAQRTLETDQTEDGETAAAAELEQIIDQVVKTLIPTLPAPRLRAIPTMAKMKFIAWWQQEQAPPAPVGEAPGQPSTPA